MEYLITLKYVMIKLKKFCIIRLYFVNTFIVSISLDIPVRIPYNLYGQNFRALQTEHLTGGFRDEAIVAAGRFRFF